MKIRKCFVSNSSTSSFVIIGKFMDIPKYTIEQMKKILANYHLSCDNDDCVKECFTDYLREGVFGFDCLYVEGDTNYVMGYLIADVSSDECAEEINISLDEIARKSETAKLNMEKLFGEKIEMKFIAGIRPS